MEALIPLGISKHASTLDGLELLEVIPVERLKALIKSDLLLQVWDKNDEHSNQKRKLYSNEKKQLEAYLKKYNHELGGVVVKYEKPKHKWGRAFPVRCLGLSCFRRAIRNTLIKDLYYDFDLKNAQPEILRLVCEAQEPPIECPIIQRYCKERDRTLEEVMTHYGMSRDQAKELFIRICFYGSIKEGGCEVDG
jgi:hypothetical protein